MYHYCPLYSGEDLLWCEEQDSSLWWAQCSPTVSQLCVPLLTTDNTHTALHSLWSEMTAASCVSDRQSHSPTLHCYITILIILKHAHCTLQHGNCFQHNQTYYFIATSENNAWLFQNLDPRFNILECFCTMMLIIAPYIWFLRHPIRSTFILGPWNRT